MAPDSSWGQGSAAPQDGDRPAAEILREAVAKLEAVGVAGAERDAQILLLHLLGQPRHRLAEILSRPLDPQTAARFAEALAARLARQPVSQIIGRRAFWSHDFLVTRDTLDPRPETELLVEVGLEKTFSRLLDLGTGTGAILISLLAERPQATGLGVDLSPAALAVARENARRIGVKAEFAVSDWFAAVEGRYDLIVSNPPYIALAEMPDLAPEVREWEPWSALTDHGDGLGAYRLIAAQAASFLQPDGRIAVEIGHAQGAAVKALFEENGFGDVEIRRDLSGKDRVVLAQG